jgi:adenine-specific DNA-methyltransferase
LDYNATLISELVRTLREDGSLCWQVGNYIENGEVIPLDVLFYPLFKSAGLKLRNRIIWRFGHGLHASKRFSGRYEVILWFTKSDTYSFNLDSVRVPSKYPGKRHFKGPRVGQLSGNPLGKNPSDIWEILLSDWEKEIWDIPNVKSNHPEKSNHPCQYPIELVERCILALSNEGDTVFDPYMGVGSSILAAIKTNRRAIGCDLNYDYVELAQQRIDLMGRGRLVPRPITQPIHIPGQNDKVAMIPKEWSLNFGG